MIYVTKGVRINENNLTIDIDPACADRVRTILLSALPLNALADADRQLMFTFCDALVGPLPAKREEKNFIVIK